MLPDGTEWRPGVELRAASSGRRLEGYAAAWNAPADIGGVTETIRPGAFADSLARAGSDVLALVDHDPSRLLGRTRAGTLRLSEDARGLRFEIDVPETQLGSDVLALARRGDLGGMSFGFRIAADGEAWPARDRRELHRVDLAEISVIHAHAAYGTATSVHARALSGRLIAARQRSRVLDLLR